MGWGGRKRIRYGKPDQGQQDIVDLVRDLPATVVNTTIVGDGFVDLVVGFQALTILAEIKKPGAKPKRQDNQEDFARTWRGGPVLLANDGHELVQQLIHIDRMTPPARGASDRFRKDTSQAILADCLAAADGLVVDADDLPGLIRKLRQKVVHP